MNNDGGAPPQMGAGQLMDNHKPLIMILAVCMAVTGAASAQPSALKGTGGQVETWFCTTTSAPFVKRVDHAVVSFGNYVYVIGGSTSSNPSYGVAGVLADVWKSNDGLNWWNLSYQALDPVGGPGMERAEGTPGGFLRRQAVGAGRQPQQQRVFPGCVEHDRRNRLDCRKHGAAAHVVRQGVSVHGGVQRRAMGAGGIRERGTQLYERPVALIQRSELDAGGAADIVAGAREFRLCRP